MNYRNAKHGKIVESSSAPAAASRPSPPTPPSQQEIARAAFGHWQNHGGDAEQNWLLCERRLGDQREVLADTPSPAAVPSL